jgi:hypothetical protein
VLEIVGNRCPVCGRFMKRTVDAGGPLGTTRTIWECSNTAVDHDWDGG